MKKRTVRLTSIIMVVMMIMSMTAVGAYATEGTTNGTSGNEAAVQYKVIIKHENGTDKSEEETVPAGGSFQLQNPSAFGITAPEGKFFFQWLVVGADGKDQPYNEKGIINNIDRNIVVKPDWRYNPLTTLGATVTVPVYGEHADNNATSKEPSKYTVSEVTWFNENGEQMGETDTFAEGEYTVRVGFVRKSWDINIEEDAACTINDKNAIRVTEREGYVYDATFTVKKPSDDPTDNPTVDPDNDIDNDEDNPTGGNTDADNSNTTTDIDKSAQTGDDFNVNMLMAVLVGCLLGMVAVYMSRRNEASDR